jgi:hypothetical protein
MAARSQSVMVWVFGGIFAVLGVILLLLTSAATTGSQRFEAEAGSRSGPAQVVSGSTTSGSGVTLNVTNNGLGPVYKGVSIPAYIPFAGEPDAIDNGIIELLAESGTHAVRVGFPWRETQPESKGQWNETLMKKADLLMSKLAALNIKVLVVSIGSPAWASGGGEVNSPNFKDTDYADYLEQLIKRYPGRIEAIEVWNEPSYPAFLSTTDPVRYTNILKAAYTRIKQVDSSILVLGASLYGSVYNNPDFLRGMYQAGAKDYFDVLSTHEYGDTPARSEFWKHPAPVPYTVLLDSIRNNLASIMQEYGDGNKPIWLTETGANTAQVNGVSLDKQASAVTDAYTTLKSGYLPQLKRVYWYNFANGWTQGAEVHATNVEWHFGLVIPSSPFPTLADWTRKPAFEAFKAQ